VDHWAALPGPRRCENSLRRVKNHWAGRLTTHDLTRCRIMSSHCLPHLHWGNLFVRLSTILTITARRSPVALCCCQRLVDRPHAGLATVTIHQLSGERTGAAQGAHPYRRPSSLHSGPASQFTRNVSRSAVPAGVRPVSGRRLPCRVEELNKSSRRSLGRAICFENSSAQAMMRGLT